MWRWGLGSRWVIMTNSQKLRALREPWSCWESTVLPETIIRGYLSKPPGSGRVWIRMTKVCSIEKFQIEWPDLKAWPTTDPKESLLLQLQPDSISIWRITRELRISSALVNCYKKAWHQTYPIPSLDINTISPQLMKSGRRGSSQQTRRPCRKSLISASTTMQGQWRMITKEARDLIPSIGVTARRGRKQGIRLYLQWETSRVWAVNNK